MVCNQNEYWVINWKQTFSSCLCLIRFYQKNTFLATVKMRKHVYEHNITLKIIDFQLLPTYIIFNRLRVFYPTFLINCKEIVLHDGVSCCPSVSYDSSSYSLNLTSFRRDRDSEWEMKCADLNINWEIFIRLITDVSNEDKFNERNEK